jgi:hypothetical protein
MNLLLIRPDLDTSCSGYRNEFFMDSAGSDPDPTSILTGYWYEFITNLAGSRSYLYRIPVRIRFGQIRNLPVQATSTIRINYGFDRIRILPLQPYKLLVLTIFGSYLYRLLVIIYYGFSYRNEFFTESS